MKLFMIFLWIVMMVTLFITGIIGYSNTDKEKFLGMLVFGVIGIGLTMLGILLN